MSRPVVLPPTKKTQSISSPRTRTSDSSAPEPLTRATGNPACRASAKASVNAWAPPSVGVLAMAAFPARTWISTAWTSTLSG